MQSRTEEASTHIKSGETTIRISPSQTIAEVREAILKVTEEETPAGPLESRIGTTHRCTYCHKSFDHAYQLRYHLNVHKCVCELCGKGFGNKRNLRKHVNRMHTNKRVLAEKSYTCMRCPMSFSCMEKLKVHTFSQGHSQSAGHKCETCNKIFRHRAHLNLHMQTHKTVT